LAINIDWDIDVDNFARFVDEHDTIFHGGLSDRINASRVVSLYWFKKYVVEYPEILGRKSAVVSGSESEPELKFLNPSHVDFVNFSENTAFDLSKVWSSDLLAEKYMSYDVVICNQVLEHVFNPIIAFDNLTLLLRPKGFLYISVPIINCVHGEPYFYSSGYHPRFLVELAHNSKNAMTCIKLGAYGSRKYLMSAVSGKWLTVREAMFDGNENCPTQLGSFRCDLRSPTDTWALYIKE